MSITGIDIAWARPTVAAIKATGAGWVARYFSTDASKNLTAAEVHDYPANGLSIVTVWETTTGRATAGYAAGAADAKSAEGQRRAVGLPANHVHHFAVDEDTTWVSVQPYFDGVISVLGLARVGVYGGFPVIEGAAAHGIPFLWQTVAWSGGRWSAHATIRQTGGTTLSGGADFDYAETADFGQTPRPTNNPNPTGDWLMAPTGADLKAVADAVSDSAHRDEIAFAAIYWLRRALDPTIALDPKSPAHVVQETLALRALLTGRDTAEKAAEAALKTELDTVKAAVAQATAALDTLAKAGAATTAEVQAGVAAELVKLGTALSGLK